MNKRGIYRKVIKAVQPCEGSGTKFYIRNHSLSVNQLSLTTVETLQHINKMCMDFDSNFTYLDNETEPTKVYIEISEPLAGAIRKIKMIKIFSN